MTRQYLLDTNIVSDLVRHPRGHVASRIADVGEASVVTSIIVAAELSYGAEKRGSARLAAQLRVILDAMVVVEFTTPMDAVYGKLRAGLEADRTPIGANDLLIASQAISLGLTLVTANEREFQRVPGLQIENWL